MASAAVTTSRRAILGALAVAPLAISVPAGAAPGDTVLMSAWSRYAAAQRINYATSGCDDETGLRLSKEVVAAEEEIRKTEATTVRGAAAKLWASLPHLQADYWIEEAVALGNYQAIFDREHELDFGARLVVGALNTLTGLPQGRA